MSRHGRLHWFEPAELDDEQKAYYSELLDGPRDRRRLLDERGRLQGAFNSRLLDPAVGTATQKLGATLRYSDALTDRERELVVLEVASSERCNYEWHGHSAVARKAGMSEEQLDGLRLGVTVPGLAPTEAAILAIARSIVADGDLTDAAFEAAVASIGERKLFHVVTLIGYYRATALALRLWRVPLLAGDEPVFPSDNPND
jgi:4-carboxymuconolactone decarboxylase